MGKLTNRDEIIKRLGFDSVEDRVANRIIFNMDKIQSMLGDDTEFPDNWFNILLEDNCPKKMYLY